MKTWKQIIKQIFILSPVLTLLITIPSFILVGYVLINDNHSWLAYVAYLISFYAFIVAIIASIRLYKYLKKWFIELWIVQKILDSYFWKALISNEFFRMAITLCFGLIASTIFAIVQSYSAIVYRSAWAATLAGYYFLLVVIKCILVVFMHQHELTKDQIAEYRMYRKVGILLLIINQALTVMVIYMVSKNAGARYSGNMIYVMAIYAFYMTTISIINVIRFHKQNSAPILSAAKIISLTSALVSMLSLEAAMINEFGNDEAFRMKMTGAFGGCICTLVLIISIMMIIKATKEIKGRKVINE